MTAVFKMKSELKSQKSFISWLRITLEVLGRVKFTSSPSGVYIVNALLHKPWTRIYPGTILFHLAINIWPRYNLMTYRCQSDTIARIQSTPNQWARSHQLSMSTRTPAINPSTPNQWAQSHQLSMSTRTLASNRSMPNQWERSLLVCLNEISSSMDVNTDTS